MFWKIPVWQITQKQNLKKETGVGPRIKKSFFQQIFERKFCRHFRRSRQRRRLIPDNSLQNVVIDELGPLLKDVILT